MDTSCHGLSHLVKGPGAVANGFTGVKIMSVHFQLELNAVGVLSVPKHFPPPMPAHVLMNFLGFPPACDDSVADF